MDRLQVAAPPMTLPEMGEVAGWLTEEVNCAYAIIEGQDEQMQVLCNIITEMRLTAPPRLQRWADAVLELHGRSA